MLKNVFWGVGFSILSGVALSGVAFAQSKDASNLTAEEIQAIFDKQKTRGLVLAPQTQPAEAGNEVAEVPITTAAETYIELAPEEQVNLQIAFDFDSSALRNDQRPKLATLCQVMQASDTTLFRIVGHTDSSGNAEYNEILSLARAEEVKRFLVGDCGIAGIRLEAVGVGEAFPLNKDNTRADENRRVEFQAMS